MTTGGSSPKGEARGECIHIFLGRYQKANNDGRPGVLNEQHRDQGSISAALGHRHEDRTPLGGALQMSKTGADFSLGPACCRGSSTDHAFDNLGKPIAGVGKGIEVVLALAATIDDSSVPQQRQVVAHRRLAHVKLVAQPPDMVLPFGEQGDDLESGRVADLLEQISCPLKGLCTQQRSRS